MTAKIIDINPYLIPSTGRKYRRNAEVFKLAPNPHKASHKCKCRGKGWYYCHGSQTLGCYSVKIKHIHSCICNIWLKKYDVTTPESLHSVLTTLIDNLSYEKKNDKSESIDPDYDL
jgi:hypothetical protein